MDSNTPTLMQSERRSAPWNDPTPVPMDVTVEVQCMMLKKDVELETLSDDDDLVGLYNDKEYTIVEMLEELRCYVEADLMNGHPKQNALKRLLASIDGWTCYETLVEKTNG